MKHRPLRFLLVLLLLALGLPHPAAAQQGRWSRERAQAWQAQHGWLVGANFAPSTAINPLEMWQAETFDTVTIDRELGWAQGLGMNTMRVFLHHMLWEQDPQGFLSRVDKFLEIADRHHIGVMLVLFDGVWDPFPHLGPQRAPKPHVHNSGWVQSPGVAILSDTARHAEMEGYVKGVIGRFEADRRVIVWDLFNEPDNTNRPQYFAYEPINKADLSLALLRRTFAWAREMNPSQPLTVGPWWGDWSDESKLPPLTRFMLDNSDVISFHTYDDAQVTEMKIRVLQRYGRPLLATEYMARPRGSTFEAILPIFKRYGIAAYNWGFVSGKSQTIYPWDSWSVEYTAEPDPWFHDIFRANGQPYRQSEVDFIRSQTRGATR